MDKICSIIVFSLFLYKQKNKDYETLFIYIAFYLLFIHN